MTVEIKVPALGESVTEATVAKWFKQVGDAVAADEPLVELETDKVTVEVNAPSAGTLSEISVATGATVNVGAILGAIGEGAGAPAKAKPAAAAAPAPAPKPAAPAPAPAAAKPAAAAAPIGTAPSAAKMMAEQGLTSVPGTGKDGRITKGDVITALERPAAPPAAPAAPRAPDAREVRVRMTRLRKRIAERLKEAQNTAAMLTTFNEVDMQPIMDLRATYKELFEKKHGVKLGFMGFFTMAVVHALKEIPNVNAEIDGEELIYKNYAHIGVAVGTDRGLVVPVVRDADKLTIAGVEKEINRLGKLARDGALSMADMQGGTFTISNGGVYGSLMSTPILNAPQSGILGMHKIQDRPVVVGGQIVIRPMMYLALSYDHRIVDGKEAVTFLVRVKESLEAPERLVLDL